MKNLGTSVCVAACMFFLGACGPAIEGEELEGAESTATTDKKSNKSEAPDPNAFEIAEPSRVYAQSLVGDLESKQGAPVATYSKISTASNQWSVSCNGGSSRDIAYVWKVPETGSYTFSTVNSNFDTVLQIRNYKATSEVMGCNDDINLDAGNYQSRIKLTGLVKGVILLIIIEGYAGEYGNVNLNIVKNPT
ncbi:hypothetical protein ACN28E_40995 [Archangium lansingense]|uniref:hypothetical protein n=1 Tax=Archangium lansingense TaxID=2995310 RepID=UPI003B76ADB2